MGYHAAGADYEVFEPDTVFLWTPPDGMGIDQMPSEFVGLLDRVDEEGRWHVIVRGPAPNDFTKAVFRKRAAL